MTFEEKIKRIDEIVKILNSGEETIEMQLKIYEEGVQLINECRQFLTGAEKKIIDISQEKANVD
ncbi:MAG: exodeoxyribonuclease VII small subunit [Candidatus Kapaibacteriota bacterium]|jgi:exodeoxyribonuclease VII small subunit